MRPVLVLGTGRCGSTLLSQMIRLHPEAVSVSELFSFVTDLGMRIEGAFPPQPIDGPAFWKLLSDPQPRQSILLRHDLQMPEVTYPWSKGSYTPDGGLPPIMAGLVPHLAPERPDELFDAIGAAMTRRPFAPVEEHYQALFAFLAERFAASFWVERSGGSLRVAERLLKAFPHARIVHLVRDGRDTSISMSRHIGFRMALLCGMQAELLGTDPYESADRSEEDDLTADLSSLLPENFSQAAFKAFRLDPALCGHYWAGEIGVGLNVLDQLSEGRLLTMRYEDLLAAPTESIKRLDEFMTGEVDSTWVEHSARLVDPRPARWPDLPDDQRSELHDACRPGFEALAARGLTWD